MPRFSTSICLKGSIEIVSLEHMKATSHDLIFLLMCEHLIMSQGNQLSDELKLIINKFEANWEEWNFELK